MAKTENKNSNDVKSSLQNIALNIIIFLLGALIIYLSYSIYLKVNDQNRDVVFEGKRTKAAEIIQVEVLNGCGVKGVADRFTDFLRTNGFDVVNIDNYKMDGREYFNVDKTMILDRIGNKANAREVAKALGVKKDRVFQHLNKNYFLDVSIVIGKDFNNLEPIQ